MSLRKEQDNAPSFLHLPDGDIQIMHIAYGQLTRKWTLTWVILAATPSKLTRRHRRWPGMCTVVRWWDCEKCTAMAQHNRKYIHIQQHNITWRCMVDHRAEWLLEQQFFWFSTESKIWQCRFGKHALKRFEVTSKWIGNLQQYQIYASLHKMNCRPILWFQ